MDTPALVGIADPKPLVQVANIDYPGVILVPHDKIVVPSGVNFPLPDGYHMWISAGTAPFELRGQPKQDWNRARLLIQVFRLTRDWLLHEQAGAPDHIRVMQATATASPVAMFNESVATNAGWAVDWARPTFTTFAGETEPSLVLECGVAVRDSDGYLYRVAFQTMTLTVFGR